MSIVDDEQDQPSNRSGNQPFEEIVQARISRRGVIGGGMAVTAAAAVGGAASGGVASLLQAIPVAASGGAGDGNRGSYGRPIRPLVGFQSVPATNADTVTVPPGYTATVLIAWGDPVSNGPAFQPDASNTWQDQELQWGMHNDGLVFFPFSNGDDKRGLIVQNHEYTDDDLLFPDGSAVWTADKTKKSLAAHGVSVIEVRRRGRSAQWEIKRPSQFARRITGYTPMTIGGPAAGDPRLRTSVDPTGTQVLGTLNNCAMGYTPWGTYLACEENFNGYFRTTPPYTPTAEQIRYGISAAGFGYKWFETDDRFDLVKEPNESNRFGWVVEIDPFDPRSTPIKRTALGRFKHEGAWVQEDVDGRLVVYSGDDERFEYIYRFVSNLPWREARRRRISPLDDGILYVARFDADGTGEWLELSPNNPLLAGWSPADILINTRTAADTVGATPMDRPEWIDTFPDSLTAIATLTNNSQRGTAGAWPTRPSLPRPGVDAINKRSPNPYGQILSWTYKSAFSEPTFRWDVFAYAGDPAIPAHQASLKGDFYGSPDGLYVSPRNRLWIQTDVAAGDLLGAAYTQFNGGQGFGNNMMLCADPITRVTRRFLVGPVNCEVTGVFVTPDERTMFVGIQHPGEAPTGANDPNDPTRFSSWPQIPPGGRPRSSLVMITKDDGGEIGS
jgi:secreted PhoX family phosphatase